MSHSAVALQQPVAGMEQSPFRVVSKKLVMWLFIISDAVTFGAILFGYGYLRNASPAWPHPFRFSPSILNVMVMTFVLVTSSLTMLLALRAANLGEKRKAIGWIGATVLGGFIFAVLHIREWLGLIHEGMGMSHNPWGEPLFGGSFFAITGLHLTHVVIGIIALTVVALGYSRGRYTSHDIEVWSLYWHFVDLVWMFVVPLVYLLSIAR